MEDRDAMNEIVIFPLVALKPLEVVGKPSRAPGEQGARRRETGVYTRVHEDFEPPSNAVIPSAVGFTTASYNMFELEVSQTYDHGNSSQLFR